MTVLPLVGIALWTQPAGGFRLNPPKYPMRINCDCSGIDSVFYLYAIHGLLVYKLSASGKKRAARFKEYIHPSKKCF